VDEGLAETLFSGQDSNALEHAEEMRPRSGLILPVGVIHSILNYSFKQVNVLLPR